MVIPWYGLAFFTCYMGIIWFINGVMLYSLRGMPPEKRSSARWLAFSNTCLAAGDSVLLLSLLISFLQNAAPCDFSLFHLTFLSSAPGAQLLTVPGGIFATSVTMSLYYLFLACYVRDRFEKGMSGPAMTAVYILCAARLLLLFHPDNVWLSSCLPEGMPNYSAWLRNAPFFAYGIFAILALARALRPAKVNGMGLVVAALLCSFTFYGMDVFLSHRLRGMGIWMAMIAKTVAYIVAAVAMWRAEFEAGPRRGGDLLQTGADSVN